MHNQPILSLTLLVLAALTIPGPEAALAREPRDHDRAREAVATGERLPLSTIVVRLETQYGGRILEIERENEHGRELYEIELLDDRGRVIELDVDATTGEIVDSEHDD